jgi:hypothetical protein
MEQANARTWSMNRWTTGLSVRFFNVMIATGQVRTGSSTGNTFIASRL